jgi:hypothetical protein
MLIKTINFHKILKGFNLIIPFFYIAVGGIFFSDLISGIDRKKRIGFGVIILAYGLFRIYKAYSRIREKS